MIPQEQEVTYRKEVGRRIANIRRNLGYSQEMLAIELQINRSSLSDIERGKRRMDVVELINLAELFGVTVSLLLGVEAFGFHVHGYSSELKQLDRKLIKQWAVNIPIE